MTTGFRRPSDLPLDEGILDRYRTALRSVGELRQWRIDGIDRTGLPVVSTLWTSSVDPAENVHGVGYGAGWPAAEVGALGETAERVVMSPALRELPVEIASYRDMSRRHGLSGVADPLTLTLPAGSDYHPDRPIAWVPATRWRTGEQVMVPVEFIANEPSGLPAGSPDPLITPISNGLGAGDTVERAVGHALLELVQRDGDTVSFRALDQGVVIDLNGLTDPSALATVEQLRRVGIEPVVKVASTEFACVVYAAGRDSDPQPAALAASAVGEAAHPDAETAIGSALLEYASSRARRALVFGPLAEVERVLPDYFHHELALTVGPQEPRALQQMREWIALTPAQLRDLVEPILLRETSRVLVADLPVAVSATPAALLDTMLGRLADFDVLVVSGRIGDIHAAKVLAPGLEVETLSYLRIGERVFRRLLERDSPLVGLGRADRPGRLPLRLDAAATARIGGPAWLDRHQVDAAMGRLYPLYREPGRHAVQRLSAH